MNNFLKRYRLWSIVVVKQQNQLPLFQSSLNKWFISMRFQDRLNQKDALFHGP